MKKLTIIATGLIMFLGTAVFANEGEKKSKKDPSPVAASFGGTSVTVTEAISKSFTSRFAAAESVTWKQKEGYYFADFKWNKQDMFAAYNEKGELLALSRNLQLSQLPLHVEMSIRERCKDYKINDLVTELVFEGETTYHLQVEDKLRYMRIKSDSYGNIDVVKRTKKKLTGSVY